MAKGEDYTYDSDGNKRLKYAIDKSDPVKTAGKYVQAAKLALNMLETVRAADGRGTNANAAE